MTRNLPVLILDWWRCSDGVKIVDLPPPRVAGRKGSIYEGIGGGRYFRCKSKERARPLITSYVEGPLITSSLEDPFVVRFINASSEDELIEFFRRFGFPGKGNEASVEDEINRQGVFTTLLKKAASGDAGQAIASLLERIRLRPTFVKGEQFTRLALRAETLSDFMAMEIVLVALADARLDHCKSCGKVFLTGTGTGRRSTAEFCEDRCRQRNHRKHEKEGRNVNTKAKMEGRRTR